MLEEKYGSKKLLLMMAVTALITGLINIIFFRGSVLLGQWYSFYVYTAKLICKYAKGTIPITLILVMIIYMGREFVNGILQEDNISQTAHLLGEYVVAYLI